MTEKQGLQHVTTSKNHSSVAYGYDATRGFFMTVFDERLSFSKDAPDEASQITQSISSDGSGAYFCLYTGQLGKGLKVSEQTLAYFLERFGIEKERIDLLLGSRQLQQNRTSIISNVNTVDPCL